MYKPQKEKTVGYMSEYVTNDLRRCLNKEGEEALRKIGIRKGQTVLDFGCGSGNYTIPAARIVGEEGRVYALDKNGRTLDELMQRAESEGLKNISAR